MRDMLADPSAIAPRTWSVIDAAVSLFRAIRSRRRFAGLRDLDDRQLDDIGLTRDDLRWGLSLPLTVDAARAVTRRKQAPGAARGDDRPVNAVCPWTGRPVSSAAVTRYRGHLVGFGSVDARHEFERARDMFDRAIAGRCCC